MLACAPLSAACALGVLPHSAEPLAPQNQEASASIDPHLPFDEPAADSSIQVSVEPATGGLKRILAPEIQDDVAAPASAMKPDVPTEGEAPANAALSAQVKPEPAVYPIAVMIENSADARPQSGLAAADIVFEAMAEGGISRFMAIYMEGSPPTVGPVRSARHYFVNIAAELGASLVHIGSSPLGFESIRWYGLSNLDESAGQSGFWRSRSRLAPHNAYTSIEVAREALAARSQRPVGGRAGFALKPSTVAHEGRPAPRIGLDYEPWGYRVEYRYDPAGSRYARFMEGRPHLEAGSSEQLAAASVLVMQVHSWVIDAEGRLDMWQVGAGSLAYFADGVVVEGTWIKPSHSEITRFLDSAGNPLFFSSGTTWVQVVSPENKVGY